GEEEQVTGLEVRRGHGLAGLRLVPRVAWKVDAMGAVDAVGEPGAVESVGGDAGPQVAQAVELLRGLHEVLAAGLLGLLSDVVDINVIGVDPGRSTTGEGDADIVDVLGDERQVDVEADVGTASLVNSLPSRSLFGVVTTARGCSSRSLLNRSFSTSCFVGSQPGYPFSFFGVFWSLTLTSAQSPLMSRTVTSEP